MLEEINKHYYGGGFFVPDEEEEVEEETNEQPTIPKTSELLKTIVKADPICFIDGTPVSNVGPKNHADWFSYLGFSQRFLKSNL